MKFLTTLVLLLVGCLTLHAQNKAEEYGKNKADRAKNRTERRADNRVDRAVDRAVDNMFDGVEGLFKKKRKKPTTDNRTTPNRPQASDGAPNQNDAPPAETDPSDSYNDDDDDDASEVSGMMQGMFGGKVDIEEAYRFDLAIDFRVVTTDKKGKQDDPVDMTMLYPKGTSYTGMTMTAEGSGITVITDLDRMVSINITGEQAMVLNMRKMMNRFMEKANADYDPDDDTYSFRKTGVQKTIAGHSTDEYEIKDTEAGTTTLLYMAPDLSAYSYSAFGFANAFNQAGKNKLNVDQGQFEEMGGMMLGMETTDRKGERVTMMAQRTSETPVVYDMSKYEIMKLPGM